MKADGSCATNPSHCNVFSPDVSMTICSECELGYAYDKCELINNITAANDPGVFRGSINTCAAMTTCSTTKYQGLTPELEMLFSCHVCTEATHIPFAYVQAAGSYAGIIGLSENAKGVDCLNPVATTFSIATTPVNAWNFPANCALGIVNPHSTNPSSLDSTAATPANGTNLKVFCAACKSGFTPMYNNITANVKVVYQCVAMTAGCETSGTELSSC